MRIAVSSDERTGVAQALADELRRRGHENEAYSRSRPRSQRSRRG